jgi:hypothetical protein
MSNHRSAPVYAELILLLLAFSIDPTSYAVLGTLRNLRVVDAAP